MLLFLNLLALLSFCQSVCEVQENFQFLIDLILIITTLHVTDRQYNILTFKYLALSIYFEDFRKQ
jgi:hypothetical protein